MPYLKGIVGSGFAAGAAHPVSVKSRAIVTHRILFIIERYARVNIPITPFELFYLKRGNLFKSEKVSFT